MTTVRHVWFGAAVGSASPVLFVANSAGGVWASRPSPAVAWLNRDVLDDFFTSGCPPRRSSSAWSKEPGSP